MKQTGNKYIGALGAIEGFADSEGLCEKSGGHRVTPQLRSIHMTLASPVKGT